MPMQQSSCGIPGAVAKSDIANRPFAKSPFPPENAD